MFVNPLVGDRDISSERISPAMPFFTLRKETNQRVGCETIMTAPHVMTVIVFVVYSMQFDKWGVEKMLDTHRIAQCNIMGVYGNF